MLINYSNNYYTKSGSPLVKYDLRQLLESCSKLPYKKKDAYGGIYCYLNPTKQQNSDEENGLKFSGLFFIDLDTKGENEWITNRIFDHCDKLFLAMPNIVCMKISHGGGLHVMVYDKIFDSVVEDEKTDLLDPEFKSNRNVSDYKEKSLNWLVYFSHVVKKVLDVDLREYETSNGNPVLDTHNINPYQQLGLSNKPFKWNDHYVNGVLTDDNIRALKELYPDLYISSNEEDNPDRELDDDLLVKYREGFDLTFNEGVPRVINSKSKRFGCSGDSLRRKIAMCLLIRCGFDKNLAIQTCKDGFEDETAKQIIAWIKTYGNKDGSQIKGFERWMKWLFKEIDQDYVEMKRDEYLNQVLDVNKIDHKYIYIVSNTGTGKTEWIKKMVDEDDTVIAVSPNLAILEGKKGGDGKKTRNITGKVYNNKQQVDKRKGMMTTMEQVCRMSEDDLKDKVLIIDEAHLLNAYLGMRKKLEALERIIMNMDLCKKVIFLSATPSGERYIRDFKVMKYIKKTNARVIIHHQKLNTEEIKGKKGGITVPCYKYIIEEMMKVKNCIVFSNRRRNKWDEAGIQQLIDDKLWGEYNSSIKEAKGRKECYEMMKGENGNKMLYDWIFATCFLGVGVEVKCDKDGNRIKEGHVTFFVDEGFDVSFIEQCIGRFRDMEDEMIDIHVHLYYTKTNHPGEIPSINKLEGKVKEYYEEAVGMDENGEFRYNTLMRRFLGISGKARDPEIDKSVHDAVGRMMAYKVYNDKYHATVEDIIIHVGKLPYKEIIVMKEDEVMVEGDVRKYEVKEKEFMGYMANVKKNTLGAMLDNNATTELLNGMCGYDIPYKNYGRVRKYVDLLRRIYAKGWNLYDWIQYANGEMSKIITAYKILNSYMALNDTEGKLDNNDDFDLIGIEENLKKEVKKAYEIFNPQFLNEVINLEGVDLKNKMEVNFDPIFESIMGLEDDEEAVKVFLTSEDKKKVSDERKKKTYEITMADKLSKYGLEKGMKFEGQKSLLDFVFDACGKTINTETIRLWNKKHYLISY